MTDTSKAVAFDGTLDDYQYLADKTAIYPKDAKVVYPLFGLVGEVGEFANKYKKVIRDGAVFEYDDQISELGDILWYLNALCSDLDIPLHDIAKRNVDKLYDRKARGVIGGSGDNR